MVDIGTDGLREPGPSLASNDVLGHHSEVSIKEFAARLWTTREARGLLVTELNDAVGLSPGNLTRIETMQRKSIEAPTLASLADALGVTMDWLWSGRPDPPVSSFLAELESRRLREVVEQDPGRWRLSTVVAALELKIPCDKEGVPIGGWSKVLEKLEKGTATASSKRKKRPSLP